MAEEVWRPDMRGDLELLGPELTSPGIPGQGNIGHDSTQYALIPPIPPPPPPPHIPGRMGR